MKGKLNGLAVRVPLLNASLTDCVFEVETPTTVKEVNEALKEASLGELKGILGYEEKPLVSTDYTNDTRSSIIDALSTQVIDGTMVKIYAWVSSFHIKNIFTSLLHFYLQKVPVAFYFVHVSMTMKQDIPKEWQSCAVSLQQNTSRIRNMTQP